MSFTSAIALMITVILVYYVLVQVYTVLLRITGITKDKASFQAVSLFTTAGFTTSESEIITGDKSRRAIAKSAMVTGYFFSVVIVSLVINMFLSIDFSNIEKYISIFILYFGGLILFFIFMNIPSIKKKNDRIIESLTVKIFKHAAKENYISVLDSYGTDDAVCKVFLYKLPKIIEGKKLSDTDLKKVYNLNVLMYERKGQVRHATAATIFSDNDILLVFGPLEAIKNVFILHEIYHNNNDHELNSYTPENFISIIDNYDYQVLCEIKLNVVPDIIKGKTLVSSHIKDFFNINIMMVSRDTGPIRLTKDTVLEEGDKIILFGPYENIEALFGEKRNYSNKKII